MGRTSDAKERLIEAMSELIWLGSYGSTSVDDVCERAGVKKGSFYHFFASKTNLCLAALDAGSSEVYAELDRIYSPAIPPLERIRGEARWGYNFQCQIKEKFGKVLGCPLFSLGAEIGTSDELLANKIKTILDKHIYYYESAIRDAQRSGEIAPGPVEPLARRLFAYAEGMLTQGRIHNDISYIADIEQGFLDMLGVTANR